MGAALALGLALLPGTATGAAAQAPEPWCFTGLQPGESEGKVWLPRGDLFCPLLADPRADRSFLALLQGDFPSLVDGFDVDGGAVTIGAIGIGESFPIVRFPAGAPGNGVQVGLVGGVTAQFLLDAPSSDLINADYTIGLPITVRRGGFSSRLRVYHQSSHLGDELLLRTGLEREELVVEAVEALLSQELGPIRVYGGGQVLFNREPSTLESTLAHGGVELRLGDLRGVRLLGALDVKASERQGRRPGWSARVGAEVVHWRDGYRPPRVWALLVALYDGPSPYGQFFQDQVRYVGIGVHLSH